MSLLLSWRRFPFFDREQVKDPEKPDEPFLGLQELDSVGSWSGNGFVLFGEKAGGICQMTRTMAMSYWKAHTHRLLKMAYVKQHNVLVTIGEDTDGGPAELKVWHLGRQEKGTPFCSRVTRVPTPGNRPAKVSSLAVHSNLFLLAIGFDDSSVFLYRGEITREKTSGKPTLVRDGLSCASDGEILGLNFRMLPDRRVVMFVVATHAVLSLVFREKELERKTVLDSKGGSEECWTVADAAQGHQLVVARRDMVFFYDPAACASPDDGPGAKCLGFDGDKLLVRSAGPYLAIVSHDLSNMETTAMNMVTLYDVAEQYIAFSSPMPEVAEIFYEWGAFFVLCKNGKLFRLQEKEVQDKLQILFRKNLFDLATNLAKRYYCDSESLSAIFKQHGDYLYQKGDFDNAAREYIQTIGSLEPSYVIRKFLDAQRIAQLTLYLEAVHRAGLGSSEHTTILLNCYTKLGDASKIAAFLKASAADMPFDLQTAIKVLSGGNYVEEALTLATEHNRHDLSLQILLEKKKDAAAALKLIAGLPTPQATQFMKKYGKVLINAEPKPTESLIKDLCREQLPKIRILKTVMTGWSPRTSLTCSVIVTE